MTPDELRFVIEKIIRLAMLVISRLSMADHWSCNSRALIYHGSSKFFSTCFLPLTCFNNQFTSSETAVFLSTDDSFHFLIEEQ